MFVTTVTSVLARLMKSILAELVTKHLHTRLVEFLADLLFW